MPGRFLRERSPETTPRVILMDPAGKTLRKRMPKSCRRKNIWYLFVVTMKVGDERIRNVAVTDEY